MGEGSRGASFVPRKVNIFPPHLYSGSLLADPVKLTQLGTVRPVKCQKTSMNDVHIPIVDLPPRPDSNQDDIDDWNESLHGLFEWVGMAGLGAQRFVSGISCKHFLTGLASKITRQ